MKKIFELRGNGEYMDIDYVNAKLGELSDLVNDDNGFNLNYDVDNNGSFEVTLTNTVSNKELCWKYTDLVLTVLVDEVMDERLRITSEEEAMDLIEKRIHAEMGITERRIVTFKRFNEGNKVVNTRDEGYYWVKFNGKWIPGEYEIYSDGSGSCWSIVASDEVFKDEDFEGISPMIYPIWDDSFPADHNYFQD